jgi:Type IV secretion system pilin
MRLIPARPRRRRRARRGTAPPGRRTPSAAARLAAALPAAVLTAVPPPPAGPEGALAAAASIAQVIANTTAWITGILAGIATLFLTIGGLRYLMASGDPGEVEKAKTALKSAAIGYGLAILAPVIVTVLKSLVSG